MIMTPFKEPKGKAPNYWPPPFLLIGGFQRWQVNVFLGRAQQLSIWSLVPGVVRGFIEMSLAVVSCGE